MKTFFKKFWKKLCPRKKQKFTAGDILFVAVFAVLLAYSILLIWLMVWSVSTSFKDYYDDFALGNVSGFPVKWVGSNYSLVFDYFYYDVTAAINEYRVDAFGLLGYTLLYTVGCAFVATFIPCITAYVVARFGKKYRILNVYTSVVLVCMILPIVGNYPSELSIVRALGMYDSIWGIWILKANFLTMYYMVFLGTFGAMPDGFAEAAKIDGAGNFSVCFKIYMPLARNLFATVMLIQWIIFWNDYQTPLLYLESYPTLAYWMYMLVYNPPSNETNYPPVMAAGAMLLVLPILVIFLFFSKRLMGNISMGGLKE